MQERQRTIKNQAEQLVREALRYSSMAATLPVVDFDEVSGAWYDTRPGHARLRTNSYTANAVDDQGTEIAIPIEAISDAHAHQIATNVIFREYPGVTPSAKLVSITANTRYRKRLR